MEITEETKQRLAKAFAWIEKHKNDSQDELRAQFSGLVQQYNDEIADVSEAQFNFKPSDDEWSMREVTLHVSNSMRGCAGALKLLAGGTTLPNDVAPGVLDDDPGNQAEIIACAGKELQAALDALDCLDGSEDLKATFKHPFFGPINSRQTAAFNTLHLNIHVKQVQRVKGYDAYPG